MGGINDDRADPKGILVLREYSADQLVAAASGPNLQQVVFVLDLTTADGLFAARKFAINPNDTVLATESPVTAANTVFRLIGSVFGLGTQISRL
jgi:polysaccharide export outer membrane protein